MKDEVNNEPTGIEERGDSGGGRKSQAKKPYQKPEVRHERVFETMALSLRQNADNSGTVPPQP